MSEEKYEDKVLRLLTQLVEQNKPPKPQNTESSKEHVHTSKDVFDCPECGAVYLKAAEEKLRPQIEKEIKEKFKSKDLVTCDDCGDIVEKDAEECSTCHGKHAH